MKFSIIIPAHNEEQYIKDCFESIEEAAKDYSGDIETIVVLNRCSDATEDIARMNGAKIAHDDSKILAKIRNAGAKLATGEILITIDADSQMSPNMLKKIEEALNSGKYIGGGVPVIPERYSLGIWVTMIMLNTLLWLMKLTGGLYWCYRKDFEAIGGFNEDLILGEDLAFAKLLRAYGKAKKLRLIKLPGVYITTSMRKMDKFGDWFFLVTMLKASKDYKSMVRGNYKKEHLEFADKYFYDYKQEENKEDKR